MVFAAITSLLAGNLQFHPKSTQFRNEAYSRGNRNRRNLSLLGLHLFPSLTVATRIVPNARRGGRSGQTPDVPVLFILHHRTDPRHRLDNPYTACVMSLLLKCVHRIAPAGGEPRT